MEIERDNHDLVSAFQNMSVAESKRASNWQSQGRSPRPEMDGSASSPERPQVDSNSTAYIPFRSAANDTSRYRRLDPTSKEIRCLVIHPYLDQGADAPLVCSLSHTSLNDAEHLKYFALSYCWGDISKTVPITLIHRSKDTEAGADASQQYQITLNLESALRELRHESKNGVFWVDAICINQHDPVERSAQVSFMRQIYAASEQVIVWLGGGNDAAQFIFRTAKYYGEVRSPWEVQEDDLGANAQERRSAPPTEEWEESYVREFVIKTMIEDEEHTWAMMLSSVLSRPWFSRVWVIQEVFCEVPDGSGRRPRVPRTTKACLIAGSSHCSFDNFCRFIEKFGPIISANQATSGVIVPLTQFQTRWLKHWKAFGVELGIVELLAMYQDFQASDSRDKLFALLALSWDAGAPIQEQGDLIQADYCKTPINVCIDFARYHIGFRQDLQLFGCTKKSLATNTPSWAPDVLSSGTFELFFDVHESMDDRESTAELDSTPEVELDTNSEGADSDTSSTLPKITFEGSTLRVMGNVISCVDKILDAKFSAWKYINSGAHRLLLTCSPYETDQEHDLFIFLNAFTREFTDEPSDALRLQKALCMFTMCSRNDANYSYSQEEFQAYLDESATSDCMNDRVVPVSTAAPVKQTDSKMEDNPFLNSLNSDEEKEKSQHPFWRRIITQCHSRCLFVTDSGELGLGPRYLPPHKDDLVVALDTAKFPHILRPCPEPELEGKFRLVGPCSFYDQQYMNHPMYAPTCERPVRLFEIV